MICRKYAIILSFLIITWHLLSTEKPEFNKKSNEFQNISFSSSFNDTDNDQKILNMKYIAYSGIGLFVSGSLLSISGTALFIIGYIDYLDSTVNNKTMQSYTMPFYITGLIGFIIGDIIFLAGLSMFIIGLAAIKYLKQESSDISMESFFNSNSKSMDFGIKIKL